MTALQRAESSDQPHCIFPLSILSCMVCYQDSFPSDHVRLCVPLFAYHPVEV